MCIDIKTQSSTTDSALLEFYNFSVNSILNVSGNPSGAKMREMVFILLFIILGTLPFMLSRPDLEADTIHVTPRVNPDQAITNKVVARLAENPNLAKRNIQVTVRYGVVTLTGEVADEVESRDALVAAREVPGVKKVKLNLTIGGSWSNASEEAQRLVEESRNDVEKVRKAAEQVLEESVADTADMAITAAVKLKLVEDADVNAARIHVNTHRGVVRLTGEVADTAQMQRAVSLTRSVKYVVDVDSQLAIINPDTGS